MGVQWATVDGVPVSMDSPIEVGTEKGVEPKRLGSIAQLVKMCGELKEALKGSQSQVASLESQIGKSDEVMEAVRKKCAEEVAQVKAQWKRHLDEKESEARRLAREVESLTETLDSLRAQFEEVKAERDEARAQVEQLNERMEAKGQDAVRIAEVERERDAAYLDRRAIESQLCKLRGDHADTLSRLARSNTERDQLKEEVNTLKSGIGTLKSEAEEFRRKLLSGLSLSPADLGKPFLLPTDGLAERLERLEAWAFRQGGGE